MNGLSLNHFICLSLLTGQENSGKIVHYSDHFLNSRPFDYQTTFDHLNTRLVWYSDPYCSIQMVQAQDGIQNSRNHSKVGH